MKPYLLFLLLLLPEVAPMAQDIVSPIFEGQPVGAGRQESAPFSYGVTDAELVGDPVVGSPLSLAIDCPMTFSAPWGAGVWDVHNGFNASLSAGVVCGFGRNNPYRGAAFFTSVEGLYAFPVSDRLTLAAGLGYTRYTGWGQSQGSLDIFGLANYRFNERLDATLFLSHSSGLMGYGGRKGVRQPYIPGISGACTTVGAEVGLKVNDAVRVGVGFSVVREEGPRY